MNRTEYNQCVEIYADHLYRFILKNLKQEEMTRDIVQNSFITLWQNKAEVNFEKSKSYLFTIAYRKMIDELRKSKKTMLVNKLPETARATEAKNPIELRDLLHKALDVLPEIQKQLVLLKDYEGYNYEELAAITGLNAGQVKVNLFRARTSLKKILVSVEANI